MINFKVEAGELLKLNKFIKTVGPKILSKHHIKVFFNSNFIELSFPEGSYNLTAYSDACGTAMVPGAALIPLLKIIPKNGTVSGILKNGEISIGSTKISNPSIILKLGVGKRELSLPINPGVKDILALRYSHSTDDIEDWGIDDELQKVEAKFEEVLDKVAKLMVPYLPVTVTKDYLRSLVVEELTKS